MNEKIMNEKIMNEKIMNEKIMNEKIMNEKIIAKANGEVQIVEKQSKKGKTYMAVQVVINGKAVNIGFCNMYTELQMQRAGVKFSY